VADAVVQARQVTKRYGREVAVEDLDLAVEPGTTVGCIGPSGSGKSTTVRLLTGIVAPSSGEVRVFGAAPTAFGPAERTRMGYMPQLNVLYPHLSLRQNLDFAAALYGVGRGRRRRLREALAFVELDQDRRKLLRDASGGMQRRLALAAALVHEPELLFLDEPTAGIDPILRRKFWDHFAALTGQGRTLFVTTQYVGEAAYCDRVAVLSEGRLLLVDTPEGLRRQAAGGEMVDLEGEQPLEDGLVGRLGATPLVAGTERLGTDGRGLRVVVDDAGEAIPRLQAWFGDEGVRLRAIEQHLPPFDDVFVTLVEEHQRARGRDRRGRRRLA
jgi:ABC-2 type transport system ATP-binding protein